MSRVLRTNKIITRQILRAHPKVLFLFGDNIPRKGMGGQAKEMRGEPNAHGIITKRYPNMRPSAFFYDHEYHEFCEYIDKDFQRVFDFVKQGGAVVIPPLGIGLAKLPENAPKCFAYLQDKIFELENLTCEC